MADWYVGQSIVCIDDRDQRPGWTGPVVYPVKGQTYTIREISTEGGPCGFRLEEILNEKLRGPYGLFEPRFNPRRFRPVKNTSIDVFTALLVKNPDLVDA
jgi:hypothetical protein